MRTGEKERFRHRLRRLRENYRDEQTGKVGLTLRELGLRANVDFAYLGAIESARRNAGEITLRKIARALALSSTETESLVRQGLCAAGRLPGSEGMWEFPAEFHCAIPTVLATMGLDPKEIQQVELRKPSVLTWRMVDGTSYRAQIEISDEGPCSEAA